MAVATALVARKSAPAETEPLLGLCRLVLVAAAIPALSMIIQVLPLGYVNLANPIWESTRRRLASRSSEALELIPAPDSLGLYNTSLR
jgi:hypothetical protein